MISLPSPPTLLAGICLSTSAICLAQAPASMDEPVRVTVSLNNDGSRTVYQFDNAKHQATATTSEADGKARGKIIYEIGENGRFLSGAVFGPDGSLLFKTLYKYDAAGRLERETHLAKDDRVIQTLVYRYDAKGQQLGISVFDPNGKPVSAAASPGLSTSSQKSHNHLSR